LTKTRKLLFYEKIEVSGLIFEKKIVEKIFRLTRVLMRKNRKKNRTLSKIHERGTKI